MFDFQLREKKACWHLEAGNNMLSELTVSVYVYIICIVGQENIEVFNHTVLLYFHYIMKGLRNPIDILTML